MTDVSSCLDLVGVKLEDEFRRVPHLPPPPPHDVNWCETWRRLRHEGHARSVQSCTARRMLLELARPVPQPLISKKHALHLVQYVSSVQTIKLVCSLIKVLLC